MPTTWDHYQGNQYKNHGSMDEYDLHSGQVVLPVAEMPPTNPAELAAWSPVDIVQVHAPYRLRKVHFRSEKSGAPPVLPSPSNAGAFTFLSGVLLLNQPRLDDTLADFLWEGKGSYVFVERCRSDVSDGFVLAGNPWTMASQLEAAYTVGAATPAYGAVAQAGTDARIGYSVASQISTGQPYSYAIPSFYPGLFFNNEALNGTFPTQ